MAHIRLQEGLPGMRGLLAFRPETARPLSELADVLLHAPGPLPLADRELIGAYVSELNRCDYCRNSHAAIAACHLEGVAELESGATQTHDTSTETAALVSAVMRDPESAPITPKLKALLAIAARVQRSGRDVRDEDIARARAEGATDLELHDTVLIAAAFCFFNRYVDGLATWTPTEPEGYRERAAFVAEHGYASILTSGALHGTADK
jgi:uncharacterized peroxidase-related enzyme